MLKIMNLLLLSGRFLVLTILQLAGGRKGTGPE